MPRRTIPDPLSVPWNLKPVESARTRVDRLADGRIRFSIVHDVVRGVTPEMLVWWFNNIDGEVTIDGRSIPRYRAWHPRDHIELTYLKPGRDGRNFSAGAKINIVEAFGANPEYLIDVVGVVDHLDESGMRHREYVGGVQVTDMEYSFTPIEGGTLYENSLTVGTPVKLAGLVVNNVVRPWVFPDAQGDAWMKHNVEEVGSLEHFLPALFHTNEPNR